MEEIITIAILIGVCVVWPAGCVMDEYFGHKEKLMCIERNLTPEQCKLWRNQ